MTIDTAALRATAEAAKGAGLRWAGMDADSALALLDELDTLRDTLAHRSDALNRVAAENDQLRAQVAKVKSLANEWGDNRDPSNWHRGQRDACIAIRKALDW